MCPRSPAPSFMARLTPEQGLSIEAPVCVSLTAVSGCGSQETPYQGNSPREVIECGSGNYPPYVSGPPSFAVDPMLLVDIVAGGMGPQTCLGLAMCLSCLVCQDFPFLAC
jgi:hypothetical protein